MLQLNALTHNWHESGDGLVHTTLVSAGSAVDNRAGLRSLDDMEQDATIRPLQVEDAAAMVGVLNSAELYKHIGGHPPTKEQLSKLYARQAVGFSPDESQEWMNWIVLIGGSTPVGYVQASRLVGAETAEIAWVIGAPWQGRGYATGAVALMLEELVSRGVDKVVADIHPANKASEGVARGIGMEATDEVVDGETRWAGTAARVACSVNR